MEKYLFFLLITAAFIVQSCSINTEITYFKDSTSTSIIDIDAKEMIAFAGSIGKDSADSNGLGELEKLPQEWTSLYDMQENEGKEVSKDPDSIRLLKKMFMKSKFEGEELSGFSLKLDKFTTKEYEIFNKMEVTDKAGELPVNQDLLTSWTGKTLTIDTSKFNTDALEKTLGEDEYEDEYSTPEEKEERKQQTKTMMAMFNFKIGYKLNFESRIKEINGKHDWIQKIDDHTVKINIDMNQLLEDNPNLTNKDKLITIITE